MKESFKYVIIINQHLLIIEPLQYMNHRKLNSVSSCFYYWEIFHTDRFVEVI